MKILVCITHVPDTTSKITFIENNSKFNSAGVQFIIGPYDEYALSKAIDIRDKQGVGEITVLNVGTSETENTLRKALAIGADKAVRVDSEPISSIFTATQISNFVKNNSFDLVLMGRESIDFNGGIVHTLVAEMLDWECVNPIMKLDIVGDKLLMTKEVDGGKEEIEANLPLVLGCQEPIAEWKIPSMKGIMSSRTKPLVVIDPIPVSIGSKVLAFEVPQPKSGCKMIDPSNLEQLVELLKNEAKVLN